MMALFSIMTACVWIHEWQINLLGNQLCGVDFRGRGTYTIEGISAFANALSVNTSVTSLSLGDNNLGDEGVEALSIGLKDNKSLLTLDLHSKFRLSSTKFGPKGAAALASALAVMASITSVLRPVGYCLYAFTSDIWYAPCSWSPRC